MFLPLREFENRFTPYQGSSYKIDDISRTIEIRPYPPFSFAKWVKNSSWKDRILFIITIIVFILSFLGLFWLGLLLITLFLGLPFRAINTTLSPDTTLIDINNQKFIFTIRHTLIGKKKVSVPFNEIKNIQFERKDENTNEYTTETAFAGHIIKLIQWPVKKRGKTISYNIVTVRNETEALSLVQWFDEMIGLKMWNNENILRPEQDNTMLPNEEITFSKSVPGEDFTPEGFDTVLTDVRFYKIFKADQPLISISMDALASIAFIESGNNKFLIKRLATNRKDYYKLFSVPAFDYSVTNYFTNEEAAKLAINNVRKSWQCYNATVSLPGDSSFYLWNFKLFDINDLFSGIGNTRYNGGLINVNKSVNIFSKFLGIDTYGRPMNNRPRNQIDLQGYIKLQNTEFNPVLIALTLYLFEMELIPLPQYYNL